MPEYLLPDVGEGLTEAEIVSWKVKPGDSVAINDVVVEIETAKSIVELPSPFAGVVNAVLIPEGETVPVGTPIVRIGEDDAAPASKPPFRGEAPDDTEEIDLSNPAASGGGEGESLVGRNKAERGPQRRARRGSASPSTEAGQSAQLQLQGAFAPGGAQSEPVHESLEPAVPAVAVPEPAGDVVALAKPPVRKLAKELGVDLRTLTGTGPNGSITREDVSAGSGGFETGASAPSSTTVTGDTWTEPVKGVRKMMAGAMVGSAFSAPHVTEWVTTDITASIELARRLEVSPLVVLAKAVCLAIRRTPVVNSVWGGDEITFRRQVNLGIAAATPRGLVVPNIKGAESMTLAELRDELRALVATAREGKTQPAEMSGGTFTITNVGVFGVDSGTPIINPGESAILAFGATNRRPWVVGSGAEERLEIRDVCTLALSFDHRHIDGAAGSQFLADVAGIMSDPGTALLY